jgi:hypothetical protein
VVELHRTQCETNSTSLLQTEIKRKRSWPVGEIHMQFMDLFWEEPHPIFNEPVDIPHNWSKTLNDTGLPEHIVSKISMVALVPT